MKEYLVLACLAATGMICVAVVWVLLFMLRKFPTRANHKVMITSEGDVACWAKCTCGWKADGWGGAWESRWDRLYTAIGKHYMGASE